MPDWFDVWVEKHALTFGLNDAELKTLLTWQDALGAAEFELHAATAALANDPRLLAKSDARFLGKMTLHLNELLGQVREQRSRLTDRQTDEGRPEMGACTACSSTGWAIVPHLRFVVDGEWVPAQIGRAYPTMTVICTCAMGAWVAGRQQGLKARPMTLLHYRERNPRFGVQLERRAREEAAYRAAQAPLVADRELPKGVRRLEDMIGRVADRLRAAGRK